MTGILCRSGQYCCWKKEEKRNGFGLAWPIDSSQMVFSRPNKLESGKCFDL